MEYYRNEYSSHANYLNKKMIIFGAFLHLSILISPIDAYRILAIFPLPVKSHYMMFEAIIKVLAYRGHQIDVMTHYPLDKPVRNINLVVNLESKRESFVNSWDFRWASGLHDKLSTTVPTAFGNDICKHLSHPDLQKIIKNPPADPPYDLLIAEALGSPCYIGVGWKLRVPVILASSFRDIPWLNDLLGQPTNTAYIPQIFTNFAYPMSFFERLQNTLKTYTDIFYFRCLTDDVQNTLMKKYIDPNIPPLRELEKNVVLALVNSYHSLHGVRPLLPNFIEVAGLHIWHHYKPLPSELEKWMNDSTAGVIYFTLGSMVIIETMPDNIVRAFYSVFKKIAPIRVLMKVANKDKLLPGLPSNVKISSWIPQVAVLGHKNTVAFITHGGLMGTQEALTFGVPMVGIPIFSDQFININTFVEKNMALKLDYKNLTEDSIYEALNGILNNPKYRNAVKCGAARFMDRPLSAENATIYWTEYAIRNGPGALRSPTVDMPWWQVALLDVYLFIFLSIVLVSYLVFVILRIILFFYATKNLKLHDE